MSLNFSNYKIIKLLGEGGMANVYLATNRENEFVAIKILNNDLFHNSNLRKRFVNEAQKMLQLQHPNIVKFIELIEETDKVAIVMEYIEGFTLREILNQRKLTDSEITNYLNQIVTTLNYFHIKGFIHRDIKPSNFIVDKSDKILLSDFGISKDTSGLIEDYTQTATSASLGTPLYMSPEQVRSVKEVSTQSDIYSLGVLLWEMVAGKKPYDSLTQSTFDIQLKIVQEQLPLTNTKWDGLIQKATEKDEINRIQQLEDFLYPIKYSSHLEDKTVILSNAKRQDLISNTALTYNNQSIKKKRLIQASIVIILLTSMAIYLINSNNKSSQILNNDVVTSQDSIVTKYDSLIPVDSTSQIVKENNEEILEYKSENQHIENSSVAKLYLASDGRKYYRVLNSILFWTFDDNRKWNTKNTVTVYDKPYSNTIIDRMERNTYFLGLDVEYHYYKLNKALVNKVSKSPFKGCPNGDVMKGDTILLLNGEGECYWNAINKGKFTGVNFSDEGKILSESAYDGCNMIQGKRLTFDEEYIVWVKIQTPSRKIGWLRFSNKKGDNFFDYINVEDEGHYY